MQTFSEFGSTARPSATAHRVASWLLVLASALAAATIASASGLESKRLGPLASFHDERFGFSISYPADLFEAVGTSAEGAGRQWATPDGRARLIAGTLVNDENLTLAAYRSLVLAQSYPGVALD